MHLIMFAGKDDTFDSVYGAVMAKAISRIQSVHYVLIFMCSYKFVLTML